MKLALLEALVIASGGVFALGSLLIVLLLLNGERGPWSAFTYVLGYAGAYFGIGVASVLLGQTLVAVDDGPSPGGSALLLVFGLLLLGVSIRQWRSTPEPDAGPPAFMAKLDSIGPLQALGFGVLVASINIKNLAIYLAAISVLARVHATALELTLAVGATVLVFCGGVLLPLLIYALLPRRAAGWLAALRRWIETHSHSVARVVLPLFGLLFALEGGRGLWLLLS